MEKHEYLGLLIKIYWIINSYFKSRVEVSLSNFFSVESGKYRTVEASFLRRVLGLIPTQTEWNCWEQCQLM